ncbi:hypothetical protein D3C80_497670 [compost metagenome]
MVTHETGDESGGRAFENLTRRRRLFDAAVIHDDDDVGQRHGLFLAVGDVNEGDAQRRLQLLQLGAHTDLEKGIERRQRLIQQKGFGIGDQSARQRHTLLLPAGKLGGTTAGIGLKLHQLQHLKRLGAARFLVHALHLEAESDIVDEIEMRKQGIGLEHHRRAAFCGRQIGNHQIAKPDITAGNALVAGNHSEC